MELQKPKRVISVKPEWITSLQKLLKEADILIFVSNISPVIQK